jgi:hypothetical protein
VGFDRQAFDELGYARLPGVFSDDIAAGLRDVAWSELTSKHGVHEHDSSTWTVPEPRHWKRTRTAAARLMVAPPVSDALDVLLGPGAWRTPDHWHVLVTFPTPGAWRLPHRLWHIDGAVSRDPSAVSEVKLFAFFGSVGPRGGGTLVLPRSHRMLARLLENQATLVTAEPKQLWARFMAHAPWLKALASATDASPDRAARFMAEDGDVQSVPARVVELTGEPGDVVLCHPMLFHCVSPNTAACPRFMRTTMIKRLPA